MISIKMFNVQFLSGINKFTTVVFKQRLSR